MHASPFDVGKKIPNREEAEGESIAGALRLATSKICTFPSLKGKKEAVDVPRGCAPSHP